MEQELLMNTIALADCEDRALYRLNSRNLTLGVFVARERGFRGIRTKWCMRFIDTEYHWEDGAPFGTCQPVEKLPDALPLEITLSAEEKHTVCRACRHRVKHCPGTVALNGPWQHIDSQTSLCRDSTAVIVDPDRDRLRAWLRAMERRYEEIHEPSRIAADLDLSNIANGPAL